MDHFSHVVVIKIVLIFHKTENSRKRGRGLPIENPVIYSKNCSQSWSRNDQLQVGGEWNKNSISLSGLFLMASSATATHLLAQKGEKEKEKRSYKSSSALLAI